MYDPQTSPPVSFGEPPPPRRSNTLLWVAGGLGAFVVLAAVSITLLLVFAPGLRSQLPFFGPTIPPPPEAPSREAAATSSGPIKIEDNFDQATNRWDQSQGRIVEGTYELRIDTPNYDGYGLFLGPSQSPDTPPDQQFQASQIINFDLAVDAQQVAGDPTSEYGIRFRQSGPSDYLMFSISGSGYYRLLRVTDDTFKSEIPWTFDRRVRTGPNVVNRLRVVAEGDSVTGYINGEQVITFNDSDQTAGQLTLGLGTFDQGGLVVRFANIEGKAEAKRAGGASSQNGSADLKEDFSNPETARWSIGGATITNGSYEIFSGPGVQSWQQPLPQGSSKVTGNFVLEVDATLVSGSENEAAYGVMFGDGGDFNYYGLFLLPQGGLMFLRYEGGQEPLVIIEPVLYDKVKPGLNSTNKIRVEVRDSKLRITINDGTLRDIEIPPDIKIEGMAGMIISSGSTEGSQARFDNFKLEELR